MEKGHALTLYISNESASQLKSGHAGFSLQNADGKQSYFDFGMVGASHSKGHVSSVFSAACQALPVAGVFVYSAVGALLGGQINPAPAYVLAGAFAGSAYGAGLGLGVGILVEQTKPYSDNSHSIKIDITQDQYDRLVDYTQKHKISFYSLAGLNCVTYIDHMMERCGIETTGKLTNVLTPPSAYARRIEAAHTGPPAPAQS